MSSSSSQQTDVIVPKRKFGGPQPNAGRKKGGTNRRTKILRQIADAAVRKGKSPLDIMLKNMRFFDEKAQAMLELVESKLGDKKVVPADVLALLQEMSGFRMNAQKCAVDAAPFIHPKLTSIAFKDETNSMKARPEADMSEDELADYYSKLRLRPTTVEPLIIDNDTGERVHADAEEEI